jgi:DNA-binding response OmpR family regulator
VRILLVEDEIGIADFVLRALRADGHVVQHVSDGVEGERRGMAGGLDLVILDIALPGRNGLDVLGAIRSAKPGLPVIMLTARGEVADKVAGLDAGATDYVTKPFSVEELLARVRAHLRPPQPVEATELSAAGIHVDLLRRSVVRDGTQVTLSAKEFELLVYFMRHPTQVLSRERILTAVWGYDHDPGTNIVEVYVGYLRRKLNVAGEPAPIETVRSVGYRLAGG